MKLYQDPEWLHQKYIGEGLSTYQMGCLAECDRNTISRWLRRHGIPIRTISEATRRACADPAKRQKMSETMRAARARGSFVSAEYYQKMSEVAKARWENPEYRQKVSTAVVTAWGRGDFDGVFTPEHRQRLGAASKASWQRGDFDGAFTPERRQKLSDTTTAAWARGDFDGAFTDEVREKQRDAMKTRWARGDFDGMFESPTTIEIAVVQALEALGLAHECEYRPPGYTCVYDVLVYPDILIEVQGDYWHTLPGRAEHDAEKAEWACGQGFMLVELWEADIREAMAADAMADFVRSQIQTAVTVTGGTYVALPELERAPTG